MELYCREVNVFDEKLMNGFSREHLNSGTEILAGDASLVLGKSYHEFENFYDWYKEISKYVFDEDLKKGQVGCSVYLVFQKCDDKFIGIFDIRHNLNFKDGELLGHIGVDIRPSCRGEGYYKYILELCIEECKKYFISEIVISCEYDNLASKNGIEHLFDLFKEMIPFNGTYLYIYKKCI